MGRIDYLTNKEIDLFKQDSESIKLSLEAQQVSIANSIQNGIGADIIETLKNDSSKSKEKKKKSWFRWLIK
jgi:hypothetical protein